MDRARINALRREIATIEGRPAGFGEQVIGFSAFAPYPFVPAKAGTQQQTIQADTSALDSRFRGNERKLAKRLSLGIDEVDRRLGGGLPLAALHEIRSDETRGSGAATGFAAALLTRLAAIQTKPILWIEEEMAGVEAGLPFGGGLARFGFDPARLILIRARRSEDALWVFEEGLRCGGLAAALLVLRAAPRALDLTVSRRLALRSAANGVMGLLLRQASTAEPGAATTRWRIAPRPAAMMDGFAEGIGRPAWRAELEKSRLGPVGQFDLEWDHGAKRFAQPAAAVPVTRPAVPFDRPRHPAVAGAGLAPLEKAG